MKSLLRAREQGLNCATVEVGGLSITEELDSVLYSYNRIGEGFEEAGALALRQLGDRVEKVIKFSAPHLVEGNKEAVLEGGKEQLIVT